MRSFGSVSFRFLQGRGPSSLLEGGEGMSWGAGDVLADERRDEDGDGYERRLDGEGYGRRLASDCSGSGDDSGGSDSPESEAASSRGEEGGTELRGDEQPGSPRKERRPMVKGGRSLARVVGMFSKRKQQAERCVQGNEWAVASNGGRENQPRPGTTGLQLGPRNKQRNQASHARTHRVLVAGQRGDGETQPWTRA